MYLKYSQAQHLHSKYLFEVKLKYFSSVPSVLNEFLRYSACSRQTFIDICERCNTLKRHQTLTEIIYRFSKDRLNVADTMNIFFTAWGWFSEYKSLHLGSKPLQFHSRCQWPSATPISVTKTKSFSIKINLIDLDVLKRYARVPLWIYKCKVQDIKEANYIKI